MSVANFARALTLVLEHEGGFANHAMDPGGATMRGITRATLERARGRPVPIAEVMALTGSEAAAIYRRFYWDAVAADALPEGLAVAVFDCAVNSGPSRAARFLQRVVGVSEDGIVGPVTIAAARRAREPDAIRAFTRLRLGFLGRLPSWPVFGKGWRRRVEATERAALAVAPADGPLLSDRESTAGTIRQAPSQAPSQAPTSKEIAMIDTKSILSSRTVWANLVGLGALGLSAFGFNTSGLDAGLVADAVLQAVTGASLVASTLFRVVASKRIAG